jgi:hypothetical protein
VSAQRSRPQKLPQHRRAPHALRGCCGGRGFAERPADRSSAPPPLPVRRRRACGRARPFTRRCHPRTIHAAAPRVPVNLIGIALPRPLSEARVMIGAGTRGGRFDHAGRAAGDAAGGGATARGAAPAPSLAQRRRLQSSPAVGRAPQHLFTLWPSRPRPQQQQQQQQQQRAGPASAGGGAGQPGMRRAAAAGLQPSLPQLSPRGRPAQLRPRVGGRPGSRRRWTARKLPAPARPGGAGPSRSSRLRPRRQTMGRAAAAAAAASAAVFPSAGPSRDCR